MQSAGSSGSCCSNTFSPPRQHRERRRKELFVGHEIGIMVLTGIHAVARHEIRAFLLLHRAVGVLFELHLGARLEAQLHAVELVKALRRNLVDEAALAHTAHLVAGKRLPIVGKMLFGIVAGADIGRAGTRAANIEGAEVAGKHFAAADQPEGQRRGIGKLRHRHGSLAQIH